MSSQASIAERPDEQQPQLQRRELGARSLTAAMYERVRADIITNRLVQGEKLHLATLQDQYGVSLSVVREALSRLVADGLVLAEAQRGFRVSAISMRDLADVMRTRSAIEGAAIELAIENGDAAWRAAVEQGFHNFCRVLRTAGIDASAAAHADFHRLLVAPCDSVWLMRFRDVLFEQSERYRYASVDRSRMPHPDEIEDQHRGLVDAVLKGDSAMARAAIAAHFASTLEHVRAIEGLA